MNEELKNEIADYYINNESTYREVARLFGVSRSSVSNIIHKLEDENPDRYILAKTVIDKNLDERSHRGGVKAAHNPIKYNFRYKENITKKVLDIIEIVVNEHKQILDVITEFRCGKDTFYKYLNNYIKYEYPDIYIKYKGNKRRRQESYNDGLQGNIK